MGAEQCHRDGVAADAGGPEPGPADETGFAQRAERLRDRERVFEQREEAADARDKIAGQREVTADAREQIADRREAVADAREQIADRREAVADAREQAADRREAAADTRDERLDTWQEQLCGGPRGMDTVRQSAWEAIERARALVAFGAARLDRSVAASLRREAREVRQQAESDRNVANTPRRGDAAARQPDTGVDRT